MRFTNHPWDEIYRAEGRVFSEPFPGFDEVVQTFIDYGCRKILDLGCGNGRHLVQLASKGFTPFGFDISPTGLRLTQEWSMQEGLWADLVLGDMRHPLPFHSGCFDGVLSTQVIHHALIAEIRLTIDEIRRLLKDDGVAFITVLGQRDDSKAFEEIEPGTFIPTDGLEAGVPHHIFSEEEVRIEFRDFEILDVSMRAEGKVLTVLARKS